MATWEFSNLSLSFMVPSFGEMRRKRKQTPRFLLD